MIDKKKTLVFTDSDGVKPFSRFFGKYAWKVFVYYLYALKAKIRIKVLSFIGYRLGIEFDVTKDCLILMSGKPRLRSVPDDLDITANIARKDMYDC